MDEVDYSQFKYRYGDNEPPKKNKKEKKPKPEYDYSHVVKGKKRGIKKAISVIVVIIVCFSIVFLCANFFTNGRFFKSIYSLMVKQSYNYYFVASSYPTRDMAHAGALLSEKSGGAGYLLNENGDYYVLNGIYTDKNDAQRVVDKNKKFFLHSISFQTSFSEEANLIFGLVKDVSFCLDSIDVGTFTESNLASVLTNYIISFSSLKSENEQVVSLVTFIVSCLKGLDPGITERATLLFQTRHMLCSFAVSASNTLNGL